MNDRLAEEILMQHADKLAVGTDTTELLAKQYPELGGLLKMAQTVSHEYMMVPVSSEFVQSLEHDLLRTPLPLTLTDEKGQPSRTGWIVGAVALGVGSAATAIILATRKRQRVNAELATAAT